jgi:hypothetical protein
MPFIFIVSLHLLKKNTTGSKLPLLLTVGKETAQMVLACLQALAFVLVVLVFKCIGLTDL